MTTIELSPVPLLSSPAENGRQGNDGTASHVLHLQLSDELSERLHKIPAKDLQTAFCAIWSVLLASYLPSDHADFLLIGHDGLSRAFRKVSTRINFDDDTSKFIEHVGQSLSAPTTTTKFSIEDLQHGFSAVYFTGSHVDQWKEQMLDTAVDDQVLKETWRHQSSISQNHLKHCLLSLNFEPLSGSLSVNAHTNRITAQDLRRTGDFVSRLLPYFLTRAMIPLKALPLVDDHSIHQMVGWNQQEIILIDKCVHTAIQDVACANPGAEAVAAWDGILTYEQLDSLSTKLALILVQAGAEPGRYVPLCMEKSKWAVVSLLAVAKSGATIVNLDPRNPPERQAEILAQLDIVVLLCSSAFKKLWNHRTDILYINDEASLKSEVMSTRLPIVSPGSVFLLIYTSGSTGRPKGSMMEHRNFMSGTAVHARKYGINAESRVLQRTPYPFDGSIFEVFVPLIAGGCVCVPCESDIKDRPAAIFNDLNVNWALMTPSYSRMLAEKEVPTLKTLVLGGERVTDYDLRKWAERLDLFIGYGPSECAVYTTTSGVVGSSADPLIIGRPMACRCWVVHPANHDVLLPIGVAGELLIEGPTVGRGYIHDVEATTNSFVESNSFQYQITMDDRYRCYKTGDIVRYKPDGAIAFVARKDFQVKLHGQRIELSEIEDRLGDGDSIRHCCVLFPTEGRFAGRIVAVWSDAGKVTDNPKADEELSALQGKYVQHRIRTLSTLLSRQLPEHMVPAVWICMASLPLTTSEKVHRRQLQTWLSVLTDEQYLRILNAQRDDNSVQPDSSLRETEVLLWRIWADVLGLPSDRPILKRSFISLGGDSIKAMQVVSLCRSHHMAMSVLSTMTCQDIRHAVSQHEQSLSNLDTESMTHEATQSNSRCSDAADLDPSLWQNLNHDRDVEAVCRCTGMQQGILLGRLRRKDAYEVTLTSFVRSRTSESVAISKIRDIWPRMVQRHVALRTVFSNEIALDGLYYQVILRAVRPHIVECSNIIEQDQVVDMLKSIKLPTQGPQHVLVLYPLSDGSVSITLKVLHAVLDGASWDVICQELVMLYDGVVPLQVAPSFRDYAVTTADPSTTGSLQFWRDYLDSVSPCILPTSPSPMIVQPRHCVVRRDFDDRELLTGFCQQNDLTVASVLKTVWSMLLREWTGLDDVNFGYVVSGRDLAMSGIQNLVGLCINLLICRVKLSAKSTLKDTARHVQNGFFESLPHQHISLSDIQHALKKSGNSLFNTLLSFEWVPQPDDDPHSISMEASYDEDPTEFDLYVRVDIDNQQFKILTGFWSDRFSEAEVVRLTDSFLDAISNFCSRSDQRIGDFSLFGLRDLSFVQRLNSIPPFSESHCCVHVEIENQVLVRSSTTAVCAPDGDLTYEQLNNLADLLSSHLLTLGVHLGTAVPFLFEKSKFAIISMLGILKAGAAFIGLGSTSPSQRIQAIRDDSNAPVILLSRLQASKVPISGCHMVVVDDALLSQISQQHLVRNSQHETCEKDLAYMAFTSGSTGRPKGILIDHGSLITSIRAHGRAFRSGPASRVLQFSSFAFDVSIAEILTTLVHGGCVCMPNEEERLSDLNGAVNRMNVTQAFLTPPVLRSLSPDKVPCLKQVALGGEAILPDVVSPWLNRIDLFVWYGPTECTIFASGAGPVDSNFDTLDIGKGAGARMWIVDSNDRNKLAPVGAIGELVIEGRIVGNGYLNDDIKTELSFFSNPSWQGIEDLSPRLYLTGDLVKYNRDGSILFVGRKDTQVKINGHRIELGEIENTVFGAFEGCRTAVAEIADIGKGKNSIVVFLQINDSTIPKTTSLDGAEYLLHASDAFKKLIQQARPQIERALPFYMIPQIFIPVSHIPLTANSGKVDRVRLRHDVSQLDQSQASAYTVSKGTSNPPQTAHGKVMQSIWSHVLKIDPGFIDADDDFFRLGGDSLDAIQVVAYAAQEGYRLTVADVFSSPLLNGMSLLLRKAVQSQNPPSRPFIFLGSEIEVDRLFQVVKARLNLLESEIVDIIPCSPLQEGMFAASKKHPLAYTSQNVWNLPPSVDICRLQNAWEQAITALPILRTSILIDPASSTTLQVIRKKSDLNWQSGPSLSSYLQQDRATLVSASKHLARYAIIVEDDGYGEITRYFVWTAHHVLYDGWSLSRIFDTVSSAYHVPDRVLTSPDWDSLRAFIHFRESLLTKETTKFWQNYIPIDEDPVSFPSSILASSKPSCGKTIERIDIAVTRRPGTEFTMSLILQASWAFLLSRYMDGADCILYGQTFSGRSAPVSGAEDLVWPMLTTVPIIAHVKRGWTARDLLLHLRDLTDSIRPYEHTGIQNIRSALGDRHHAIEFQNLFVTNIANATSKLSLLDLPFEDKNEANGTSYALTTECQIGDSAIGVIMSFDHTVVERHIAQRMLRNFKHVVQRINADSDLELKSISLLTDDDTSKIFSWNENKPRAVDARIEDVIFRWIKLQPYATAIDAWDGQITYQELGLLSDAMSQHLTERYAVRPGVVVPVCLDKSVCTPIVWLAVLKAGAAFLNIHPEHPRERRQDILSKHKYNVICTTRQHQHLFEEYGARQMLIGLDVLKSLDIKSPDQRELTSLYPTTDPAMLVFTSGSTGTPKGISVHHRGLCTMVDQLLPGLGWQAGVRVLQFAHNTFDMSFVETLALLMHGGTTCIPSEHDRLDNLAGVITDFEVDIVGLTPTVASLIAPPDVPRLKTLILLGEPVSQQQIDLWLGKKSLLSLYGPAECSTLTSYVTFRPGVSNMSIGHVFGCRSWIVDPEDHNVLLPVGFTGELLLEGPIVSDGYTHDAQKSASVFVSSPAFIQRTGKEDYLCYRTGDLVKYAPDGSLIFVGRKDNQVKVHGQRVELSEVEHYLSMASQIRSAVAIFPRDGLCKGRLVAVCAFEEFDPPTFGGVEVVLIEERHKTRLQQLIKSVSDQLQEHLPQYMVPALWVPLAKVPLTYGKKFNRTPVASWVSGLNEENFAKLNALNHSGEHGIFTDAEKLLAETWARELNLVSDQIDGEKSFLSHGGDSISAMKVAARSRQLSLDLSVSDILQSPSLKLLASECYRKLSASVNMRRESQSSSLGDAYGGTILETIEQSLAIDRTNIKALYPCSPVQEGMLLSEAKSPNAYRVRRTFKIEAKKGHADVNVAGLQKAWDVLVRRHDILRTIMTDRMTDDGRFHQIVLDEYRCESVVHHLESAPDLEFFQNQSRTQFGLSVPQHQSAFYVSGGVVYWQLEIHHALMDGASLEILLHEMSLVHQGLEFSRSAPTFAELMIWHSKQPLDESKKFWADQLQDCSPCYFPVLRQQISSSKTSRGNGSVYFQIGDSTKLLCREYGITIANLIQVAWGFVLRCYTGSNKVCFGHVVSGREIPINDIEFLVGPVVNVVPCQMTFGSKQFQEVSRKAMADYSAAIEHQHLGLAAIQEQSGVSQMALFNTIISIFSEASMPARNGPDGLIFDLILDEGPLEYDVGLAAKVDCHGIRFEMDYKTSVMSDQQRTQILDLLIHVMDRLPHAIHLTSLDLEILPSSHFDQILAWNNSAAMHIVTRCIHDEIEYWTQNFAEHDAISFGGNVISYAELWHMSTKAISLFAFPEIHPAQEIVLYFDKSPWAIIAMLAVLRAGCVCVVIDPAHSSGRTETIISQIEATIILCDPHHVAFLSEIVESSSLIIALDESLGLPSIRDTSTPTPVVVDPSAAAFIVYTSGSTGVPKGIVLEHGALCSAFAAKRQVMGLNQQSRTLQFASYNFDAMIDEIFGTLCNGGCVCVPSEHQKMNDLQDFINRSQINWAALTPTVARLLEPSGVPTIKNLICGGEVLSNELARRWMKGPRLINAYGPAEATITCAYNILTDTNRASTIGKPLNCTLWVADIENIDRLVPIGAIGELVVGGPNLARGYLSNSHVSQSGFLQSTKWSQGLPGCERLYRTGDLVRYDDRDGFLIFVGRQDAQIKIHGQRVELSEIENVIRGLLPSGVEVAVGLLRHENNHNVDQILTAVLSEDKGTDPFSKDSVRLTSFRSTIEASIGEYLPRYMTPTFFIGIDSIPMSSSGKIDRRKLDCILAELDPNYIRKTILQAAEAPPPRTSTERLLQATIASVLGLDKELVNVGSNFFRLGGSSVTAMHVCSKVRQGGLRISVVDIFTHPALADLASVLDSRPRDIRHLQPLEPFSLLGDASTREEIVREAASICKVAANTIIDIYPCTPLQEAIITVCTRKPEAYQFHRSWVLGAEIDHDKFKYAWAVVRAAYDILRTRIINSVAGVHQILLNDNIIWETQSSAQNSFRVVAPIHHGAPLVRYTLVSEAGQSVFIWTLNHAVFDGFLIPRIWNAVRQVYQGGSVPRGVPFKHFVQYQMKNAGDKTVTFWNKQSSDTAVVFPVSPAAGYHPNPQDFLRQTVHYDGSKLRDVTVATVLKAALGLTLSRAALSAEVVFGIVLSGRDCSMNGIEDVMGPTVTTAPVTMLLDRNQEVRQFLRRVQRQATAMIDYQHYGLQNIRKLSLAAQVASNFQTLLVIQPAKDQNSEASDLDIYDYVAETVPVRDYGLTIECNLAHEKIDFVFHYDRNMLPLLQARSVSQQFQHIFEQLLKAEPDVQLKFMDQLNTIDFDKLVHSNDIELKPVDATVHDLVFKQALNHPLAEALTSSEGTLNYQALAALSMKLGRKLASMGIDSSVMVGLCFDKSIWTVVVMLGVMVTGACIIPINSRDPAARISHIVQESGITTVLLGANHAPKFADTRASLHVVDKQYLKSMIDVEFDLAPVNSRKAALVHFTSGSTGEPKGIVLEHRSLCTVGQLLAPQRNLNKASRVLQFAAYVWDVSTSEIFFTLINGGCVCVPMEDERLTDLEGCIGRMRVNWIFCTPMVSALLSPGHVPDLKTVVLGGAVAPTSELQKWRHINCFVSYGPAECTVFCSILRAANNGIIVQSGTVGRALCSHFWLVDPHDHHTLALPGSVGELLIEGPILARGFLNAPNQTEAAFIDSPSWRDAATSVLGSSGRLYKTGDLMSWNEDGTLRFCGRKDTQVKIRSQRVELGEVESHIYNLSHDNWKSCAVEMIEPECRPGQQMLVAFLCQESSKSTFKGKVHAKEMDLGLSAQFRRLQNKLRVRLPSYMIPGAFVAVESMPYTVSMKIDRPTLRQFGQTFKEHQLLSFTLASGPKKLARTSNEKVLTQLWAGALKIPDGKRQIGVDDNFFMLGGDSIVAMRMLSLARAAGVLLSMSDLFRWPTIEAAATHLQILKEPNTTLSSTVSKFSHLDEEDDSLAMLETVAKKIGCATANIADVLEATDVQAFCAVSTMTTARPLLNFFLYEGEGHIEFERFQQACQQTINHFEILRTLFASMNGIIYQVVLKKEEVNFQHLIDDRSIKDQVRDLHEKSVNEACWLQSRSTKFYLLSQRGTDHHGLVLRLPHSCYDGLSLSELLPTLMNFYENKSVAQSPSFRSFVYNIKSGSNGTAEESTEYWRQMLRGSRIFEIQQRDRPKGSRWTKSPQTISVGARHIRLGAKSITFATVLKTAAAILFARLSATTDIVFGHLVSGRNINMADVNHVVGPCINIVPVRVNFQASNREHQWRVHELLQHVQQQALLSMPHEHVGTRHIIRECTDWPRWNSLRVVVQHQNVGERQPLRLGDVSYTADFVGTPLGLYDMYITSEPGPAMDISNPVGFVQISMSFDSDILSYQLAKQMLDELCQIIWDLSSNLEREVDLNSSTRDAHQTLPLSYTTLSDEASTVSDMSSEQAAPSTGSNSGHLCEAKDGVLLSRSDSSVESENPCVLRNETSLDSSTSNSRHVSPARPPRASSYGSTRELDADTEQLAAELAEIWAEIFQVDVSVLKYELRTSNHKLSILQYEGGADLHQIGQLTQLLHERRFKAICVDDFIERDRFCDQVVFLTGRKDTTDK